MLSVPGARELAPGLTHWTAYHEEWKHDVGCVALDSGPELVLVDPLAPPEVRDARRFWKALDATARERDAVHVVLTLHYHERSAGAVAGRYRNRPGALVWAPVESEPLLRLTPDRVFAPGDRLPGGVEAFATGRADEVVLWLPQQRALVAGDVLLGAGPRSRFRVCPAGWLPDGVSRADVAERLTPLADLPVALLVPLHGALVLEDAAATLREALDAARAPGA